MYFFSPSFEWWRILVCVFLFDAFAFDDLVSFLDGLWPLSSGEKGCGKVALGSSGRWGELSSSWTGPEGSRPHGTCRNSPSRSKWHHPAGVQPLRPYSSKSLSGKWWTLRHTGPYKEHLQMATRVSGSPMAVFHSLPCAQCWRLCKEMSRHTQPHPTPPTFLLPRACWADSQS